MKEFKRLLVVLFLLVFTAVMASCNLGKTTEESRKSMIQSVHPHPTAIEDKNKNNHEKAEKIKKEVESLPEIYDVAVLKGEGDVLVAYKVKHMQRFRMKKIEKALKKRLESKFSDETFVVSSDYKIFIEAIELKQKIKEKKISKDEAEKRLQKIIKFQKELT
ncbi:YhcN/YlaJ family sporulation lipoprotein [Mesobacillus maritimus]|uniref:YhcN/YlaJ family sporulation lipoprotein n=1 Tax=Mesobacillus maritimus TaxID=1643336 RepID=UPI00203C79A1|nr:YhcN/YlaJ family sporulation lipoprotein [Mesobacillus maritimus]MCM3586169.1 YhcN/YlaJ family sporulation lipoprotein [Mesobacillus maritimus]